MGRDAASQKRRIAKEAAVAGRTKDKTESAQDGAVVVKKYANRRLYNTASSSYVTLEDLRDMVREGVDFVVLDAKSGDDITRSVLAQIIFEQESRGQNLLPIAFLRRLIRFYGDSLQGFVPSYLEASMETFARQQEAMRERFSTPWNSEQAMTAFQEQTRQNMALFEQAMRMFTPFTATGGQSAPNGAASAPVSEKEAMQAKIDDLERTLAELRKTAGASASKSKGA